MKKKTTSHLIPILNSYLMPLDYKLAWVLPLFCLLHEYGMFGVGETILIFKINIDVFKMWCERPFCYMMNAFLTISILVWTHTHRAS